MNDYYTSFIGRQPIVITRDKTGNLNAVINACAHRGAMLCRRKHGNKGGFTCSFHGWTFSNTGKLLKVKGERSSQYPEQFNKNGSHGSGSRGFHCRAEPATLGFTRTCS
ncbi:MAG: Rieske 2Fe-2S domain-containing protein [Paracoccus sp. (in: a-proteobacteria)]|nr:Rieske 2Fe-2S domain-containing protein [Paracoccus sp. (in: a-proteobacteria)]